MWKCRKLIPTSKIFREINLKYNSLVKKLLWRNFCKKIVGKNIQISTIVHNVCFYEKFNIFSVKSMFLLKKLLRVDFTEVSINFYSKFTKYITCQITSLHGCMYAKGSIRLVWLVICLAILNYLICYFHRSTSSGLR